MNLDAFKRWLTYRAEMAAKAPWEPAWWLPTSVHLQALAEGLSRHSHAVQAEIINRAVAAGRPNLRKLSPEEAAAIDRPASKPALSPESPDDFDADVRAAYVRAAAKSSPALDENSARLLAWIRRKGLTEVTRKQILQLGPACVRRAVDARAALHTLVDGGYLAINDTNRYRIAAWATAS